MSERRHDGETQNGTQGRKQVAPREAHTTYIKTDRDGERHRGQRQINK